LLTVEDHRNFRKAKRASASLHHGSGVDVKIAIVSEHASPLAAAGGVDAGGQNVYVANVARQLVRKGHRVDVFTRRESRVAPDVVVDAGVRVVHVDAGPPEVIPKEELLPHMGPFAAFMLERARREASAGDGYDLVHANFFMSAFASLPVCRALGLPLVTTFHALGRVRRLHQGTKDGFPDARFAIEDLAVQASDRVIAECPQDRSDLVSLYDADPARIATVPCGFEPSEFAPMDRDAARRRLGWDIETFTVLQLGRLVPRKGIDNVIRSLAPLDHVHGVRARLVIVGGNSDEPDAVRTPEIARLHGVAREADVAHQVTFVGRRDREALALYYGACDVFVTTPWYEPFGITPVEAMACARPVVGARVGGIQSTVVEGVTGLLVPPHAPLPLAAALSRLAHEPDLARRYGLAGRERAVREFTWAKVGARLAEVYHDVLDARHVQRTPMRGARRATGSGASVVALRSPQSVRR
jgi:glycosyltransferase involved in cell wall biosynthesis